MLYRPMSPNIQQNKSSSLETKYRIARMEVDYSSSIKFEFVTGGQEIKIVILVFVSLVNISLLFNFTTFDNLFSYFK